LIELGIPRVLTSGGQPDVWRGRDALQSLVRQANGRIAILAGGGVTADRIPELIAATGLREVHLSARTSRASAMQFRRDDIPMGANQVMPEYEHRSADLDLLKNLCQS
jgi:copper homeostasis protein